MAATLAAEEAIKSGYSGISLVAWDIDRVWYKDISTTYAGKGNPQRFEPFLERAYDSGWISPDHVRLWESATGRTLGSPGNEYVGVLADMFTDLFYGIKDGERIVLPKNTITKEQIVKAKQSFTAGLTIGDVKRIADSVPYTQGLHETLDYIRASGIRQAGFSDGLGPFVAYKMLRNRVEVGGIVPALIDVENQGEVPLNLITLDILNEDKSVLTGRTMGSLSKFDAIRDYSNLIVGCELSEVAAIDDSAANVPVLSKIRDAGGVAVGFNVNDPKTFEESKIPVIKGDDLRPFAEIVADRGEINRFCETWGVEV